MGLFVPHDIQRLSGELPGLAHMAKILIDRLHDTKRADFDDAAWISPLPCPAALASIKHIQRLNIPDHLVSGDFDQFALGPNSADLILVCGGLDTVNDLPGALIQIRRALKPDGLFLCALPGGETLHELRDSITRVEMDRRAGLSPRIHPMIDLQTWAALMQRAGFALPVADSEIVPVSYRSLQTLLRDLKAEGGLRLSQKDETFVGKDFWRDVECDYFNHHRAKDGHLDASFEILYGIGWGPSATQQQPLRPGSAEKRLADALGTTESKLPR